VNPVITPFSDLNRQVCQVSKIQCESHRVTKSMCTLDNLKIGALALFIARVVRTQIHATKKSSAPCFGYLKHLAAWPVNQSHIIVAY
jgi:hypothetical protein